MEDKKESGTVPQDGEPRALQKSPATSIQRANNQTFVFRQSRPKIETVLK